MNFFFFATFLCLGVLVSGDAWGNDDGQWKGEGLAESQDHGQWDHGAWAAPLTWAGAWAHGAAPIGPDGRVVDTPEVAQAKAAHLAAVAGAGGAAWIHTGAPWAALAYAPGAWAHGAAPLGPDGRVVDTPEVAHAKAAHLAAKAAAGGW